nr:MAG TPA: hypothetical protein [Bacteriophage sp.]
MLNRKLKKQSPLLLKRLRRRLKKQVISQRKQKNRQVS